MPRLTPVLRTVLTAVALACSTLANGAESGAAFAPNNPGWSFTGAFGTYDRAALQRGFQIYKEVCSNCHSLNFVALRTLAEPGGPQFSLSQMQAIAAGYRVPAGPNDRGQTHDENGRPLMRAATPADYFPPPFPNEQATRTAMNGALPPDLSLVVKARPGHENYVYSLLIGYGQPPAGETVPRGLYYNPYFPRHQIAMPPPLSMGAVTYADGTEASVAQMAHDVATFLSWTAEPKLEERKRLGFVVMLYLIGLAVLLFFTYRKVWHGQH